MFFLIVLYFISCFFPSRAGLAPTKTIHCHCCKTYVDIYILTHVFVQNGAPGSAVSPWLKIIFSEVPLHSQMPSYTKIWHRPRKIVCILFEGWRHKLLPYCLEEDEPPPKKRKHIKKQKWKNKNIGKTRGQIKNNGKTKHKTIFRDSSLKHPLSKEFVCFMCFPFFSFFFPMFFVFPN